MVKLENIKIIKSTDEATHGNAWLQNHLFSLHNVKLMQGVHKQGKIRNQQGIR